MTILLLSLSFVALANAGEPPSTCGADGKSACEDADNDGFFANPGSSTTSAAEDCNDGSRLVYPGAPAALGDNAKNNCSVAGDDDDVAEIAAALAAACGKDSAGENACESDDPKVAAPAIARRDSFTETYELCTLSPEGGIWAKLPGKPYACVDMVLPSNRWSRTTGVSTLADRREAGARAAGDKALGARIDGIGKRLDDFDRVLGTPEIPATDKDHPVVPATGIRGDIAGLKAGQAKTDGRVTALELTVNGDGTDDHPGLAPRLDRDERILTATAGAVFGDKKSGDAGLVEKVRDAERTGIAVDAGVVGWMIAQPAVVTNGGELLRDTVTGGAAVALSIDSQTPGRAMGMDVLVAPMTGGVGTDDGVVPASMAGLGIHVQWMRGDISYGLSTMLFADAANNPLDASVSGFGAVVGGKAIYYLPFENPRTRVGLVLNAAGGGAANGTNDQFFPVPVLVTSFGITVGDGPARH